MVRCGASDSANVADQVGAGQRAGYPVVDGVAAGPFSSCYTSNQYRALQQFFKWWAEEEDRPDPMAGLHPPKVTEKLVPVFSSGELSKLEQARAGRGFAQRRDAAIIAVFRSTGIRLAELARIRYDPQCGPALKVPTIRALGMPMDGRHNAPPVGAAGRCGR